jgi:TatD DNase family protein
MQLIDSHAHYDDEQFDHDRDEIIRRAVESGVTHIINAGSNISSSRMSIELSKRHEAVFAAVGVHPHEASSCGEDTIETLKTLASAPKVAAIGEIGLDYHYDYSPRETQREWFAKQLELALELNMPVIIHDREAHRDVLDAVKAFKSDGIRGVFHCFSGGVEMAREVLNLGFHIGIGGPLTFRNAKKPAEVIRFAPMDRILIETDCPYLAPEPYRGKRNWSGYLPAVIEKIASIKDIDYNEVERLTAENAISLFNLRTYSG